MKRKTQQASIDIFWIKLWVNRLFLLIYPDRNGNAKRCNAKKFYLPKGIVGNYNIIIHGRKFSDQSINPDIKWYEEIKKLKTG